MQPGQEPAGIAFTVTVYTEPEHITSVGPTKFMTGAGLTLTVAEADLFWILLSEIFVIAKSLKNLRL